MPIYRREFKDNEGRAGQPKLILETLDEKKIRFEWDETTKSFKVYLERVEGTEIILRASWAGRLARWILSCTEDTISSDKR